MSFVVIRNVDSSLFELASISRIDAAFFPGGSSMMVLVMQSRGSKPLGLTRTLALAVAHLGVVKRRLKQSASGRLAGTLKEVLGWKASSKASNSRHAERGMYKCNIHIYIYISIHTYVCLYVCIYV